MLSRSIHIVANGRFPSYLWLNTHKYRHICAHIYYAFSLSICLLVIGYFGCFSVLGIVNNAAMNMGWRCLFVIVISFPFNVYPEVGLLDHTAILFLLFWGSSILFSMVAALFNILINSVPVFLFFHFLASTVVPYLFYKSHPKRFEIISHCVFDLQLPND